ncbi:MAG: BLUF domain-containing protein [Halieaceae bacterium]|jgi:hypothetical protein|nr:BLUF domain-containing protein [Halieaceae bacterium]
MKLYHLAYMSRSAIDGTDQVIEWELEAILDAASRNNPAKGITGALLYTGNYFCQVLEGPEAAVRNIFDLISRDNRHNDIHTLFFEEVPERQFPNWAMAYVGVKHKSRFAVSGIKPNQDAILAKQLGKAMLQSLMDAVEEQESSELTGISGRRLNG